MTTAFVLSGGAALGAAQVGMLLALAEAGITADMIVATSVGAVNGGWVAGGFTPETVGGLAGLWRGLDRDDVFPARPLLGLLGFLGRRRHLVPDTGLRRLLADNLRFASLEDAAIALHVIATDVLSGQDVCLSAGSAVEAILASAAIPAVFPPVRIGERDYIDGGVVNNTPISHAVSLGADTIWVLSGGYACALTEPPRSALAMALHGLSLTINQRLALDVERYEASLDLRVVPALCPVNTSPADFSHGAELIERALTSTRTWLQSPGHQHSGQAELLTPHGHTQ